MPIFKKAPVGTIAAKLPVNNATGFAGLGLDTTTLGAIASGGVGDNPVLASIDSYGINAARFSALWSGTVASSPATIDAVGVAAAPANGATPAALIVNG